ncbi:hypothetical protein Q4493_17380 [Colwellia sp. 1_MG-2023]|uniref:hypothetical protein n=1 Tax=Colwellia sp. 1_MG-2023 TaxID=3062649 RepID=UPI0026E1766F|nr:hypothetical protein [Colwellia sp. 1_MG-2023]MDO6447548.1 hypothetical protein [Colwellia sp. 1_MG-2023]
MIKHTIKLLMVTFLLPLSISIAYAETYLVCKAPKTGMAGKGGCIHAYNPSPEQVCSGEGDKKVCSTASLEDLCIKVGEKNGVTLNGFSSGLGTFKTAQLCLQSCNKHYGGKFKRFGGECFGMISK